MKWWDFTDIDFLTLFVISIMTLILLVCFSISFGHQMELERRYSDQLKEESNTLRVYVINIKNDTVTYFNRSNLKKKITIDLATFYKRFHPNDVERVKEWIYQICTNANDVEKHLEADIVIRHTKKLRFSFLKFVSFNEDKGIIHLESLMLRYITPQNSAKQKKKKNGGISNGLTTIGTMKNIVSKSKSLKGYTLCVRFFNIHHTAFEGDNQDMERMYTLKNVIYPFTSDKFRPRSIIELDNRQSLLVDLKMGTREDAYRLALSVARELTRAITINAYQKFVKFTIGIVENQLFFQDFEEMSLHAQEASLAAEQNDKQIYFYEKNISNGLLETKYKDEIDSILTGNRLRFNFRLIADVRKKKAYGYFLSIKAVDSSFATYQEMMRYAVATDRNKELFAYAARNIIPKYAEEVPNHSLPAFFNVSIHDLDSIESIVSKLPGIDRIHLVLVFSEQEVSQNSFRTDKLLEYFKKMHHLGYKIALSVKDKNLLLNPAIYSLFDYFIAGTTMTGQIKRSNLSRLSIRVLIESLLKYKKPIIATDLEGWQAVELIVKSGVLLVSSEAISPTSEMILPVEKKKMDKLAAMDNFAR